MARKQDKKPSWLARAFPGFAARRAKSRLQLAEFEARAEYFKGVGSTVRQFRNRREARRAVDAEYYGGKQSRLDRGWGTSFGESGVRSLSASRRRQLVNRARELVRNNFLASSLLEASTNYVIGDGTRILPTTEDKDFNRAALELWANYWLGLGGGVPDVRGIFFGPEIERLWWKSRYEDGDIGSIMLKDGRLQTIESDLIRTPDGQQEAQGRRGMVDGVQVNEQGRPVAFWIVDGDPIERKYRRVAAENFVYLARLKRASQVRGLPVMANSFALFEQLDTYVEAVVMAANMAAMFGLLIREPANRFSNGTIGSVSDGQGNTRPAFDMEPGMVKQIGPTDEVIQVKPEQPSTQFEQLTEALVRFAGLELNLPLEVAMLNFRQVNYSAARAALITAQRGAMAEHRCFAARGISRVYRWFISRQIKEGNLKEPAGNLPPWQHVARPQPHRYLDPLKEVQGDALAIQNGLKTQSEALLDNGSSYEEWLRIKLGERESREDAGMADEPTQSGNDPNTSAKIFADAYGVAVRAGAITPQPNDEAQLRTLLNLPAMSPDVTRDWGESDGIRKPITLQVEGNPPSPFAASSNEDEDLDDSEDENDDADD